MIILIEGVLSEPPSSVYCFRDLTLYADIFLGADVIVECEKEHKDIYWEWLKRRCAMDFVQDILSFGEEKGLKIRSLDLGGASILVDKIDEISLARIISRLNCFRN